MKNSEFYTDNTAELAIAKTDREREPDRKAEYAHYVSSHTKRPVWTHAYHNPSAKSVSY